MVQADKNEMVQADKKEVTPEDWVLVIDDSASESKAAEKLTKEEREELFAKSRKALRDAGLMK